LKRKGDKDIKLKEEKGSNIEKVRKKASAKEGKDNAILLFKRLLRGRAIQNKMFEGKEKRLALIDELLTVAATKKLEKEE